AAGDLPGGVPGGIPRVADTRRPPRRPRALATPAIPGTHSGDDRRGARAVLAAEGPRARAAVFDRAAGDAVRRQRSGQLGGGGPRCFARPKRLWHSYAGALRIRRAAGEWIDVRDRAAGADHSGWIAATHSFDGHHLAVRQLWWQLRRRQFSHRRLAAQNFR